MATQTLNRPAAAEGLTEIFDGVACLDERVRRQAMPQAGVPGVTERTMAPGASAGDPRHPDGEGAHDAPVDAGFYIEVQGPGEPLLVALAGEVTHIGRGLAADLRLDEDSVSRRHAILVHRRSGSRILDDRSSNGTLVNGRRVSQEDLHHGDVVVLGRVVLRYLEF